MNSATIQITQDELQSVFSIKHRDLSRAGWSPRRRYEYGYYQPGDYYEAMVDKLVDSRTDWIDVGGGGSLFPYNRPLARKLAERVHRIVVVDPSDNIDVNPFPHERVKCLIEDYHDSADFNLATLRMVAEHIEAPAALAEKLNCLLRPGGMVVIFTVNRWSPATMVSHLLPFWLHNPIKNVFWDVDEKDTFPTYYRMNTKQQLNEIFSAKGFHERYFAYLDDLSIFGGFKALNLIELNIWRIFRLLKLRYPENCLLCVYEKG